MSLSLLTGLIGFLTVAVVIATFSVMWAARTSPATSRAAILSGITLVVWAATVTVLGQRAAFAQPDGDYLNWKRTVCVVPSFSRTVNSRQLDFQDFRVFHT
jgi:hypothetical protein